MARESHGVRRQARRAWGLAITMVAVTAPAMLSGSPHPVQAATTPTSEPCNAQAGALTTGPAGRLWLTEARDNEGVAVSPAGAMTEYPVPTAGAQPGAIAVGSDGRLWFTEPGANKIAAMTPSGRITEYPAAFGNGGLGDITAGPDGALWFTDGAVGRITVDGVVTFFNVQLATGITAGPDGNLWFTQGAAVGRITPAGQVTEFTPPHSTGRAITRGPDGALWFPEDGGPSFATYVGRITTSGQVTDFQVGSADKGPLLSRIASGPDGNLWVTGFSPDDSQDYLARITPAGVVSVYPVTSMPFTATYPGGIVTGPDGRLWFADSGYVGAATTGGASSLRALPSPLAQSCYDNPGGGPMAGGTQVHVGGRGFTGATSVKFGGTPVQFQVVDDSDLTTVSPPSTSTGQATITVQRAGTPVSTYEAAFDYEPPPVITGVQPSCGDAGIWVVISGDHFAGVSAVTFGSVPATVYPGNVRYTAIAVQAPPNSPGPVDVRVTAYGGTTTTSPADIFVYDPTGVCSGGV